MSICFICLSVLFVYLSICFICLSVLFVYLFYLSFRLSGVSVLNLFYLSICFICLSVLSGYRISWVKLNKNKAVSYESFISGWTKNEKVYGRPVDLLELADGSLLISDDAFGKIYRVTYRQIKQIDK